MKVKYLIKVSTTDFYKVYEIMASDITEASRLAKIEFGKDFNIIGKDIKVSLDPIDSLNHIREIIDKMRS